MLVKEYRYEDDVATQREEAFNMGQQSKSKDVVIAVKEFNVTPETVATKYNVPLDKLLEELKKADEK